MYSTRSWSDFFKGRFGMGNVIKIHSYIVSKTMTFSTL